MSFPFKIIRGGQAEPVTVPKEFAKFDNRRAIIEALKVRIIASRDRAIDRERAKLNKP